jgi:hypothetical protein
MGMTRWARPCAAAVTSRVVGILRPSDYACIRPARARRPISIPPFAISIMSTSANTLSLPAESDATTLRAWDSTSTLIGHTSSSKKQTQRGLGALLKRAFRVETTPWAEGAPPADDGKDFVQAFGALQSSHGMGSMPGPRQAAHVKS